MRILFVKLAALGDVSFALPVPQAIKSIDPQCHITWVVGQTNQPLLAGLAGLDEVVEVDERRLYSKNLWSRLQELLKLKGNLHGQYDVILLAHRAVAYTMAFRLLSSAPIFQVQRHTAKVLDRLLRRQSVVVPSQTVHESVAIRKLLEGTFGKDLQAHWSWDYSHLADEPHDPHGPIVLHTGGGDNLANEFRLKKWPHFRALIGKILDSDERHIVLVGSSAEAAQASQLAEGLDRVRSLAGKTDIPQLVAVLSRASLFIGPDSGPLHIADSLGIPCVGLYGPTSVVSWGVLGKRSRALSSGESCSPCYNDDGEFPQCPYDVKCMKNLDVGDAINNLLHLT